jgi:hypothetical protein
VKGSQEIRDDAATHKIVQIVVVIGLLLLGLMLVVGGKEWGVISAPAEETLLMAMVVAFPFIIIALMQSVSSDN